MQPRCDTGCLTHVVWHGCVTHDVWYIMCDRVRHTGGVTPDVWHVMCDTWCVIQYCDTGYVNQNVWHMCHMMCHTGGVTQDAWHVMCDTCDTGWVLPTRPAQWLVSQCERRVLKRVHFEDVIGASKVLWCAVFEVPRVGLDRCPASLVRRMRYVLVEWIEKMTSNKSSYFIDLKMLCHWYNI